MHSVQKCRPAVTYPRPHILKGTLHPADKTNSKMIAILVSSTLPNLLNEKHFAFHTAMHITPERVRPAFALAIRR